ncbi:hypothetical protein T492DRAFT_146282 [Pavlovales sp. CCMP2436]|nr:hypothetical protein T492DRAFT_146282 [Pavlovales sp. CCMP2436]
MPLRLRAASRGTLEELLKKGQGRVWAYYLCIGITQGLVRGCGVSYCSKLANQANRVTTWNVGKGRVVWCGWVWLGGGALRVEHGRYELLPRVPVIASDKKETQPSHGSLYRALPTPLHRIYVAQLRVSTHEVGVCVFDRPALLLKRREEARGVCEKAHEPSASAAWGVRKGYAGDPRVRLG